MNMPDFTKIKKRINKLTDAQKKFFIALAVFIFVDLCSIIIIFATKGHSSVHLECYGKKDVSSLVALDSNAQRGIIKSSDFADFKFTQKQKDLFSEIYNEKSTVALTVRLQFIPTKKQQELMNETDNLSFRYGFLTKEDFSKKGKFIKQLYPDNKRILIQGNLKQAPECFDVSFAIQKNDDI